MSLTRSVILRIIGQDNASASFLRVSKAADKAATSADRALLRMQAHGTKLQAVGQKWTRSFTLPILAATGVAVYQAAKFQKSMVLLETATGESAKNLVVIQSGIKNLARETGTSLSQLSDGMYLAEKAGFRGANGIKVLGVAAKGAKAENVDLSTAMTALTSIMTSYHMSASQAVVAENMLIRGSGLAKTTMTDFANSLSNVVPLAAALGISFPQVAGAIATMTQHGETAQRATENLANLITNLAGSNNVATNSMQQLGINVLDLQKNLGRRGLSGTLDVVANALKKHGHAGLVVYDSMKKAAQGTASLNTMLGKMTGVSKVNSKALLDGKMGFKDYQKFAKSMGGQQGTMALQFMAAVKSILGFNNLLRSGRGNTQTWAKALQTSLGGMTGLKTFLMLFGGEMNNTAAGGKTLSKAIDSITQAARSSKTDVLGWANTSKTLSVRMDRAKQSLEVLAVEIGTALIPVVLKLVGWIQKAADKIEHMSKTHKRVIAWAVAITAALFPLIAIFGRLYKAAALLFTLFLGSGRFIAGLRGIEVATATAGTRAYRFGQSMTGAKTAVGGMIALLGGAAIGYGFGKLTENASTSTKVFGVFASTVAGAALGFAVGGPVGAALGGFAGLVMDVATAFHVLGPDSSALAAEVKADMARNAAATAGFNDALQTTHDFIGKLVTATAVKNLQNFKLPSFAFGGNKPPDALSTVSSLGLNTNTFAKASTGNQSALRSMTTSLAALYTSGKITAQQWRELTGAINASNTSLVDAANNQILVAHANGQNFASTRKLKTEVKDYGTALSLDNIPLDQHLQAVNKSTAAGEFNVAWIRDSIGLLSKHAVAMADSGKTVRQSTRWFDQHSAALQKNLIKAGFDAEAVHTLFKTYGKPPKKPILDAAVNRLFTTIGKAQDKIKSLKQSHKPGVDAEIAKLRTKIATAQGLLDKLTGRDVPITASGNAPSVLGGILSQIIAINNTPVRVRTPGDGVTAPGLVGATPEKKPKGPSGATGGFLIGAGTGTSDSILANLSNGEFVVNAKQTKKHRRLLDAINNGIRGFAKGGSVDTSGLSTAIGNIGQSSSPQISLSNTLSFGRVAGQIAHALAVLRALIHKGLAASAAASFQREITGLAKSANAQLGSIRLRIHTGDLNAITSALKGTADDTKNAFDNLIADMQSASAGAKALAAAKSIENKLIGTQNKLIAAKDYKSQVTSTLTGAFDATKYGSVTDLLQGLGGASGTNNAFAGEVNGLRSKAKGNKTLLAFINQLATSGQTATLQTLAGASTGELNQIGKAVGSYNASVNAGGDAATNAQFGESINQLTTHQAALTHALSKLAAAFVKHAGKQVIHLDINGHEVSKAVVRDPAFDHYIAHLLDQLANAAIYQ